MSTTIDLIKAIRTGRLPEVLAALDAGAQVELHDGQGEPGLPLGIACFMGHVDIVRELVMRGAQVNFSDNNAKSSPLSLAVRGNKTAVVKTLIELGAKVPPDMQTGLSEQEVLLASLKAQYIEAQTAKDGQPPEDLPVFEEIEMIRCAGTDTVSLDAEMVRAGLELIKNGKHG